MIRTTSIISSVTEVPREWVFENYLNIPILHGQDVKIKSPFNITPDKNPSFFVYFAKATGKYMFKDFSTDQQGDGVELVKQLYHLSTRGEAAHKIIDDYIKFATDNPDLHRSKQFKAEYKYEVKSFTIRPWNKIDVKFWTKFKIGTKLLKFFRIQALEDYTLVRQKDGGADDVIYMNMTLMYGYFKKDGSLYKIYQPYSKNAKYIKVQDYIQGSEQLSFSVDYLTICSSLKDMMAFKLLNFSNAECIAPDSENILIEADTIDMYKSKYKGICTLFDNDPAGIASMEKYEKTYGIPYVHVVLEKDLADNIHEHGIINTRVHTYPLLTKALTGVTKQL